MIKNNPMTYKEIEKAIRIHYPKGSPIRPEVMKFTDKGIYVVGNEQQADMFDTFMDRFVPTYFNRGMFWTDRKLNVALLTYRRAA